MQWRRVVEPDVIDSGDEAERSGEDSELEGDGGLRCCVQQTPLVQGSSNNDSTDGGLSGNAEVGAGGGGAGADAASAGGGGVAAAGGSKAKLPWVTAMVPPSNVKVHVGWFSAVNGHRFTLRRFRFCVNAKRLKPIISLPKKPPKNSYFTSPTISLVTSTRKQYLCTLLLA